LKNKKVYVFWGDTV